jgi:hypothetical protein
MQLRPGMSAAVATVTPRQSKRGSSRIARSTPCGTGLRTVRP